MLSVCIPVYNYDVTPLAKKLIQQAELVSLKLEILIMDDGSSENHKCINRTIQSLPEVNYVELASNIGSAAIRNKLALEAKYEELLFLDSDSDIHDNFISTYIPFFDKHEIVYGGRIHPPSLPDIDKSLRWKTGKIKEDHSATQRRKVPNKSFMSNNFLTNKKLFNTVSFDDSIQRSGHEDTMFGIELEKKGIEIVHIDNPVVHVGLEGNEEFIRKTEQRLETLKYLTNQYHDNKLMFERITILKYDKLIHRYKLSALYSRLFKVCRKRMEKCLHAKNPSMLIYDLYKLGYYINL